MKKKFGSKMIGVYEDQFKEHGYSPSSLGCAKGRQDLRFKALTKNIKKGKLLDFGCGFGDLAFYLDKFNVEVEYHGCDVMEKFLVTARENNPKKNFFLINIGESLTGDYDHIIASGVFNFLYSKDKKEHKLFVYKTIENLFECCNSSLSIDFQSPFVDFTLPDAYHQDINDLINFISNKLTRRFKIDHSYMPYEFCVKIFKQQEILRPENVFKT